MLRPSPFIMAAAVAVIAAGTAAAQTTQPGEAPQVTTGAQAEETMPTRAERWRERMGERRGMHRRRGMGATMRGPGIHLQIDEDRLGINCAYHDTTQQCIDAAMPVIEMFLDGLEESELEEVEDAEESDDQDN